MKRLIFYFLLLSGIPAAHDAAAQIGIDWRDIMDVSGWTDAIQSVRTRSPHSALTSRARLRTEVSAAFDSVYCFFSSDAEKNWEISDETGVDVREAWVEFTADRWDLRVGRQIIIWGKADGVQITDIISPPDYTESLTRDLDEIRMPVDAFKFRLLGDRVDTELIWIPVFKAGVHPTGNNPWAVRPRIPENHGVSAVPTDEPGTSLDNSEIALKFSCYLSGVDAAVSIFYTWDDFPTPYRTVTRTGEESRITYRPAHERLAVLGLDFSRPWSDFVFRGEAALYRGRYYDAGDLTDTPMKKDALQWLGGVDWTPGNDWTLIAQLTGHYIDGHDEALAQRRHTLTSTLNITKKLFRETLTLYGMIYHDLDDKETYGRFIGEYEIADSLHFSIGTDIFSGDQGRFGRYEDNKQVWGKIKYSF